MVVRVRGWSYGFAGGRTGSRMFARCDYDGALCFTYIYHRGHMTVAVAVVIVIVLVLVYWSATSECFSTKREKATAINEWFRSTIVPSYNQFRRAIGRTDIVEYEQARAAIAANPREPVGAIAAVL